MHRRFLLIAALAATLAPVLAPATARADSIAYVPGAAEAQIAAGETVFLDFAADWCSTCRSQERTIEALRAANPGYDAAIAFYRVDWDVHGRGDLARALGIPRRSTLVLFRDGQEVGRIVAGTAEAQIRALLDAGL